MAVAAAEVLVKGRNALLFCIQLIIVKRICFLSSLKVYMRQLAGVKSADKTVNVLTRAEGGTQGGPGWKTEPSFQGVRMSVYGLIVRLIPCRFYLLKTGRCHVLIASSVYSRPLRLNCYFYSRPTLTHSHMRFDPVQLLCDSESLNSQT